MFEIDKDDLHEDMKKFVLPGAKLHYSSVYKAIGTKRPMVMTFSESAEEAVMLQEVFLVWMAVMTGMMASLNRSATLAEGKEQEIARDMTSRITKKMEKLSNWTSMGDPHVQIFAKAAKKSGYVFNEEQQDRQDFLTKWAPKFAEAIKQVVPIRPDHEVTFVGGLLRMGMGDHITPFHILMREAVPVTEVAQAKEKMLQSIEDHAQSFLLLSVVTMGMFENFCMKLSAHSDKQIWPNMRFGAESDVMKAVRMADYSKDSGTPFGEGQSVFQHEVSIGPSDNPADAVREAVKQMVKAAKTPERQISEIVVMDDDGSVVSLKQFFEKRGEEIPQDVLEQLKSDGPGES